MCAFSLNYFASSGECSASAEIKVFVENPELTNVLPLKPGIGQNITIHVSPTARNFFLVLISTFLFHSPSFFSLQSHSSLFNFALVLAYAVSCVGPGNEISHPAHSHKQFRQVCMVSACRMGTSTCVIVEYMNG